MSPSEFQALLLGALQGLAGSTIFLLALFIGFCVLLGFPKLRPTGRRTRLVRSLDELVRDRPTKFLPPDTPRGVMDVLRTPELLEAPGRKNG